MLNFIAAVRRGDQAALNALEEVVLARGVPAEVTEEETTPLRDAFRSVLPDQDIATMDRQQINNAIADLLLEAFERQCEDRRSPSK